MTDPFDDPAPRVTRSSWFRAAFDGECSGCDESIEIFDEIRADGDGGYLGKCCGGDE